MDSPLEEAVKERTRRTRSSASFRSTAHTSARRLFSPGRLMALLISVAAMNCARPMSSCAICRSAVWPSRPRAAAQGFRRLGRGSAQHRSNPMSGRGTAPGTRLCSTSRSTGSIAEHRQGPSVRIPFPPAVSQLLGCVGTRVPDDAASAGSGIDNQLGAGAEDAPLRHPGVSPNGVPSRPSGSVRQACGYLAHHGDRPPYSEPGEQLLPVATPKHPVRMGRGLKFGVASTLVHHQVRGKENIEIG
jgi:hypothetical protein